MEIDHSADAITVHPLKVRGTEFEVQVEPSGQFKARFNGPDREGWVYSDTREGLYAKLMTLTKRAAVKVEVPFDLLEGGRVRRGVATGIHSTNRNVMVRWTDTGRTEQITHLRDSMKPLSAGERADWVRLSAEVTGARMNLTTFEREHHLDVRREIEQAIAKGAAEQAD